MVPGSVLKGRFVLEEEIGRGGMGVVFKAKDLLKEEAQDRNPYVAIKVLNNEFRRHPESLKALQRESRKAQKLAHPNIATVFDFDRDGSTVYMQMDFLEGETLDRIIKNKHFYGMPIAKARPYIEGLGHALAYAHDNGIVHSDFKPGNCFLTNKGLIKVFDLGIARAAKLPDSEDTELTKFDAGTLGALTPSYASCEMIEGGEPDPGDDIYALGCVAYELLTGRHPFDKKSAVEARNAGLVAEPVKGLNGIQQRALQKALAFRREDRYRKVDDFLEEFGQRPLRIPLVAGAVAVALLALVAVFALPEYLEHRRVENLVTELTSGNEARITASIADVGELDAATYQSILPSVRDPLFAFFEERIASFVDETQGLYDYAGALALLNEANKLMADPRFAELENALQLKQASLIVDLNAQIDQHLNAGRLLPDPDGADVVDVLEVLIQVDPDGEILSGARLPTAYADASAAALDVRDLDLAEQLINVARPRFESDRLAEIGAQLVTAREAPSRSPRDLPESARSAGNEGSSGLDASVLEANREAEIARAAEAAIARRKDSFDSSAQANDVEEALETLAELRALLPSGDRFLRETAPATLASAYIRVAEEALGDGDLAVAERYALEGVQHSPDSAELARLLAEITAAAAIRHCTVDLAGRGAATDLEGACWDMLTADVRGPTLVVVPIGAKFNQAFAIGLSEASVGDWNHYCNLSGQCEPRSDVADDLPLANVSVGEVRNYTSWLSEQTGATYRLPTLSEWQYAANQPHENRRDNCRGDALRSVTAGSTNTLGLSNYLGNLREMVTEGSGVVYRGGSYADTLCSTNHGSIAGEPDPLTGFRLMRELADVQ
jgi:non-specific serine/threonine protein kinase